MAPRLGATPALPKNKTNPAGGSRLVTSWMADFDRRNKKILRELEQYLAAIPALETDPDTMMLNARRYFYQIDPARLMATVAKLFADQLGPAATTFTEWVRIAYASGSVEARRALKTLLDDTRDLTAVLRELPYLRRLAYVEARVFESMKGFVGERGARLGAVLLEGLSDGLSLRDIKKSLVEEFAISRSRAERIARTEVIGALRRGRIDEAADTAERFGVEIGLMWFSALSPTTRQSHAELHGQVLTPDEVKEFYTQDGNAINCKCSQVEVILKDGQPIQEKLVARETERRQAYLTKEESKE